MRALAASLLAAMAAASLTAAAPPSIGADAVWKPPAGFLESMHRACDGRSGDAFSACFAAAMKQAGAPAPALAFSRRIGNQGYLSFFRETGIVDVACAAYPFRANENDVCFLVNGTPAMIEVDDPKNRDEAALRRNLGYATLLRKYPNLAIFPGPRGPEPAIEPVRLPQGGQEFAVQDFLQDGCHACTRVAELRLAFDFDETGRFEGARILTIHVLTH